MTRMWSSKREGGRRGRIKERAEARVLSEEGVTVKGGKAGRRGNVKVRELVEKDDISYYCLLLLLIIIALIMILML